MAYIDKYGVEYSDDKKTLVKCPKDLQGAYSILEGVITICENAFYNCKGLTSIEIPNSVTTIGNWAFAFCNGLTTPIYNATIFVRLPQSYNGAYTIPNGIKQIIEGALSECSGLTSVTIPSSVTVIGDSAFYFCGSLTSVTIPNSVTTIGGSAFYFCGSLTSVTIPNSVTTIGEYAFDYCIGLTSVTIPNSVTTIGDGAFYGCSGLTSVTIPNSVTKIGDRTFEDCSSLTSVTIPNSVTTIGDNAFCDCIGLTSVTIPNSVVEIGRSAFGRCSSLQGIEIPQKIKYLHEGTFAYCENLLWMKLNGEVDFIHPIDLFGCQLPKEFQLVVPTDKLNYYQNSAFKTYRITDNLVSPNRTWKECVDQWEAQKQYYTSSETRLHKSIAELLNKGLVPSSFPPFGIELTVFEYKEFKKEGRDIKSIEGWCESGIYIHQCVRRWHNSGLDFFDENSNWMGEHTPRKGFYKVISKSDDGKILNCYYNYKRGDAFLEELVEINSKPFYNKSSIGPKHELIQVNDIIEVIDTRLSESIYEGQSYKAYCIVWGFVNDKHLSTPTYIDSNEDGSSYTQYGGYNDWDDDTINSAFEGDPEATWNID